MSVLLPPLKTENVRGMLCQRKDKVLEEITSFIKIVEKRGSQRWRALITKLNLFFVRNGLREMIAFIKIMVYISRSSRAERVELCLLI